LSTLVKPESASSCRDRHRPTLLIRWAVDSGKYHGKLL